METGRVEAGLPRYGADLTEGILFSEADVPDAVSYKKGCYVGQEIVARVKTYGQLKKSRRGLLVDGGGRPGDTVIDGEKPVARLTSARFSPILQKTAAFAYLRTDVEDGREFAVQSGDETLRAVVAPYPFA
jgi:folate-binding protein YgfZ